MKIATSTKALAAVAALTMALGAGLALGGSSTAGTVQVERTTSLPVIPADSPRGEPITSGSAQPLPAELAAPASAKAKAEMVAVDAAGAERWAKPAPVAQAPAEEEATVTAATPAKIPAAKPAADPAVLDDGCP